MAYLGGVPLGDGTLLALASVRQKGDAGACQHGIRVTRYTATSLQHLTTSPVASDNITGRAARWKGERTTVAICLISLFTLLPRAAHHKPTLQTLAYHVITPHDSLADGIAGG